MDTQTTNSEYLLLFRGTQWGKGLAPEEIQNIMGKWMAWFEGLDQEGKIKGAQPLRTEGKVVSGKGGAQVADGPFAESKEAVGGYFLLQVDTIDEAVRIAQQCPALEYGLTVEVRPVAEMCPIQEKINQLQAQATV